MSEPTQTRRDFLRATGATVAAATPFAAAGDAVAAMAGQQPVPAPPAKTFGYAVVGLGGLSLSDILPAFTSKDLIFER